MKTKRKNGKIRITNSSDKSLEDNPNFYTELSLKDSCKAVPKIMYSIIILSVLKLKREKKIKSKEDEED